MSNNQGALFINNQFTQGQGEEFSSLNPANGEILWQKKSANEQDVDNAVIAARDALTSWSLLSLEKRIKIIKAYQQKLTDNKENIARVIAQETGKPYWETLTEAQAMINKVDISIEAYHERTGVKENQAQGMQQAIRHKPHGVLAVYGPYNLPAHLPNGHIVPALIAGNTIVFKPSELTPLVAQTMVELFQQAGLPNGVLNLVQGELITGKALASHAQIDGILFTGSAQTGNILHKQFAGQPDKMLALEMGGNNPLIIKDISEDNIDALVYNIIQSAFISTGQRCTCARRLFLPKNEALTDKLVQRLISVSSQIQQGDAFAEPAPFIGPLISEKAANDLLDAYNDFIEQGAKPLLETTKGDKGTGFISPGIIDVTDIVESMEDKEHFGPLLKIAFYDDFTQAIKFANNTSYGLSAGLLGGSQQDFDFFYQHIRAGIVNWNNQLTGASSNAPFGGVGMSGNHRPSALYAADYCAYPVASLEKQQCELPATLSPGITL